MPNTREKLIELIRQGANGHTLMPTETIADYLIANGVTFQHRDCHWATERAYKNGYAKAAKEFAEKVFELFPTDKDFTTISRFAIKHILNGMVGAEPPKGE